ncbi:MAG: soluble lytic murein transglycosylase-like protein [Halieaceae bacterium]|jgi:soluble lytic murein transglycosylase-like protein
MSINLDNVKSFIPVFLILVSMLTTRLEAQSGAPTLISNPKTQAASSKQPSLKVFTYTNREGVTSFTDRAPMHQRYQVIEINRNCHACNLDSMVDWHNTPLHLKLFQGSISKAAMRYRVDPALIRAVIHAESAFKPDATSPVGALGLMQLMPGTAKDMGVVDPMSPDQNIGGGVRYLAELMQNNGGNISLTTASYNAGPGAVARHQGVPPYEETRTYVKRVKTLYDRYRKALAKPS